MKTPVVNLADIVNADFGRRRWFGNARVYRQLVLGDAGLYISRQAQTLEDRDILWNLKAGPGSVGEKQKVFVERVIGPLLAPGTDVLSLQTQLDDNRGESVRVNLSLENFEQVSFSCMTRARLSKAFLSHAPRVEITRAGATEPLVFSLRPFHSLAVDGFSDTVEFFEQLQMKRGEKHDR